MKSSAEVTAELLDKWKRQEEISKNRNMKKYKLHPIGWAIKWALKDCIICIDNYNQKYKLVLWRQDANNKWHVEIGY